MAMVEPLVVDNVTQQSFEANLLAIPMTPSTLLQAETVALSGNILPQSPAVFCGNWKYLQGVDQRAFSFKYQRSCSMDIIPQWHMALISGASTEEVLRLWDPPEHPSGHAPLINTPVSVEKFVALRINFPVET
jgi:hypothetical protein